MTQRILFVDDRPEHLHQPVLRLQMDGYDVDEAADGEAALAALRKRPYDLMIIDAELPGTDGWQVLRLLREDPALRDTKVIVLMAGKGETGKLMLVSVEAELRRPFTMAELLGIVRRVLAG